VYDAFDDGPSLIGVDVRWNNKGDACRSGTGSKGSDTCFSLETEKREGQVAAGREHIKLVQIHRAERPTAPWLDAVLTHQPNARGPKTHIGVVPDVGMLKARGGKKQWPRKLAPP
jgi:hypothetical protein